MAWRRALLAVGWLAGAHAPHTGWAMADAHTVSIPMRIDTSRSDAAFSLRVALIRRLHGRFDYFEGFVERAEQRRTFSVDIRLAVLSLQMDNAAHARWAASGEFFDAERHPWIRFHAVDVPDRVLRDGGALPGSLTLRGVTRPVEFALAPAECARPGIDCDVVADGEVQRSEFGMTTKRLVVADKVRLAFRFRLASTTDGR
jgi:polyisoprenoid-binding protein YceI